MENQKESYYRGRYVIVFYEKDDDTFKFMFNNIRELCKYLGWELNKRNLNRLQVNIFRSLQRYNHQTNLFKGQCLKVYIVDITEEYD